jgi:hypothetical protein
VTDDGGAEEAPKCKYLISLIYVSIAFVIKRGKIGVYLKEL